jgi:hypothetical protein
MFLLGFEFPLLELFLELLEFPIDLLMIPKV